MKRRALVALSGLFLVVALVGCGGKQVVPVTGVVTLDGEPLADADITFDAIAGGGLIYVAKTDAEGRFSLKAFDSVATGAVAGDYRVSISTAKAVSPTGVAEDMVFTSERVPAEYRNGRLRFVVPEQGTNNADFELTSQ